MALCFAVTALLHTPHGYLQALGPGFNCKSPERNRRLNSHELLFLQISMCSMALFLIFSWVVLFTISSLRSSALTCLRLNLKSVRASEFFTVTGLNEYGSKSKDRSSKRILLLRAALALPYQEAVAKIKKNKQACEP